MKPISKASIVALMVWFFSQVICTIGLEALDRTSGIRLGSDIVQFMNVIPIALGVIAFGLTFFIIRGAQK